MNIFDKILDTKSMTILQCHIEDVVKDMPDGAAKEALLKMQDSNKLDEIWAIAHEHLGNYEEARKLREWLKGKPARDVKCEQMNAFLTSEFPDLK